MAFPFHLLLQQFVRRGNDHVVLARFQRPLGKAIYQLHAAFQQALFKFEENIVIKIDIFYYSAGC